ncbi:MAG: PQQ-binding-like beta-propeller repeat protein, partial [Bacteroidales bacterium]|nr:PQQ-binding-like beta-propeller repeat protein [Bacteroidales bacterium]
MKNVKIKFGILCVLLLIFYSGCTRKDNEQGWNTYRYDGARTGVTTEELPSSLSLTWTYTPTHPPKPVWSLPAEEMPRMHFDNTYYVSAADGLAYFGSSTDNKVYALDISTGIEKWTFFSEGPVRFSPTVYKNRVYFGSDDGYVYCLKAKSGKLVWKYRPGPKANKIIGSGRMVSLWPVRTSVLVEDGTVYFGAGVFPYDGLYICALDAGNGSVIWKNDNLDDNVFDLEYGGVSPQSYLIASEDHLFVPSGRAMPAVFDKTDGSFINYLSPGGKQGGTWGMIDQGNLVAGVDNRGTPTKISYDIETGERLGDLYASFTGIDMVGNSNVSYVISENGVYAIDRKMYPRIQQKIDSVKKEQSSHIKSLKERVINAPGIVTDDFWFDVKGSPVKASFSNLNTVEGRIKFDEQFDEVIENLNLLVREEEKLKSSTSKWFFPQEHLHSIIYTPGQVIAGGEDIVLGLNPETGKELWRSEVKGIAYGLAVSNNSLLVSTDKGPIYCFNGDEGNSNKAGVPESNISSAKESQIVKNNEIYEKTALSLLNGTSVKKGYCLVLNCGEGELVRELAEKSDLYIIGIEENVRKVKKAKEKLDKRGLYGKKIIVENWSINSLPEYFADLIVAGEPEKSGQLNHTSDEIFRVLKPGGGAACLRKSGLENGWSHLNVKKSELIKEDGDWVVFTRNSLIGAGGWTHQYANIANTCCSDDKLVMAPFSTLWYGPPGPQLLIERHARATAPMAFDGKMIIEGENIIMVYDAYNGTKIWDRKIEYANRVRTDVDGGNMAVNKYGIFVAVKNKCLQLDIETGKTIQTFELPDQWKTKNRRWGYIAVKNNILFGSCALPLYQDYNEICNTLITNEGKWENINKLGLTDAALSEYFKFGVSGNTEKVEDAFQRNGTKWRNMTDFLHWSGGVEGLKGLSERMMASDGIFAFNIETGKKLWSYKGNKIAHITTCIGDETIFFAESAVTNMQRKTAFKEKGKYIRQGKWEEYKDKLRINKSDIRLVVALNLNNGVKKWERLVDLSGCGDDYTASAYHNNVLLFFGSFGLHDKWRFPTGQLKWHRITALSSENGDLMWSRPLNYMVRPLIINDEIIIEPRKCDLYTGEIKTRIHPVTGNKVPWEFYRPGHTCAITAANDNCLFYRSNNAAYYDLKEDRGINYYGAIRPGCMINLIPGNGLVLFPEASSGCTCSFPLRTSVVLKPENKVNVEDWSLYVSNAPMTPVKHLAINLGAPGDMKDNNGTIWFGYPRPQITKLDNYRRTGVKLEL